VDDFGLSVRVHESDKCMFQYCTIHNNSAHPLCFAPQRWNEIEGHMERQCTHGEFHVDADEIRFEGLAGACPKDTCDGCCRQEEADE
jgi:hypothetical protein